MYTALKKVRQDLDVIKDTDNLVMTVLHSAMLFFSRNVPYYTNIELCLIGHIYYTLFLRRTHQNYIYTD